MKLFLQILTSVTLVAFTGPLHATSEPTSKHDEHEHHDEAEEDHESNPSVGSEKGIIAASKENGFKLSPEAIKNFEIQTLKLSGAGPWKVPLSARLLSGEEVNLYRVRDGFIKRIDFTIAKKASDPMTISSPELRAGDEVVVKGIGFLRVADLAAFGGMAHGHSH